MSKGKWRYKYQAKLKELMNYAKRLEKQGFTVDYSTFPKELKRVSEKAYRRIESWTKEDVRIRAKKESNGRKISYAEDLHRRRSEASKRGWRTRRLNYEIEKAYKDLIEEEERDFQGRVIEAENIEEDETPGWVQDIIDEDDIYWPGEGPISLNNAGKMFGLGEDFLRHIIRIIEDAPLDEMFYIRAKRFVEMSKRAGEALAYYILDLLKDEEKVKNIYANIVTAGLKDDIYTMVNDMMFASSGTKTTPTFTFTAIRKIFEGTASNPKYDSMADVEDWSTFYD